MGAQTDRLTTLGGAAYTYGNDGELATKTEAGETTTYGYDAQGNLRTVARPVPLAALGYLIDGQNRRIGKKLGGNLVQGFVYDGSRIVAELDSAGAEVARFVYATGEHSPDLMVKAGVTYRMVKDHLGSPRLVVNTATGAVVQRLDYDEWGVVTNDTAPGFQPFGFAGGLWDRDTNLVRFGARDYDPMGRWISKDATRFDGGLNLYEYVGGDPVNRIDPSGFGPLDFARCILSGGSVLGCGFEELERGRHGPLGGGSPPSGPPPSGVRPRDPGGNSGGPETAGGTEPGRGGGSRDNGICELERKLVDVSCTGEPKTHCGYFCPQTGARISISVPSGMGCPDTIGLQSR